MLNVQGKRLVCSVISAVSRRHSVIATIVKTQDRPPPAMRAVCSNLRLCTIYGPVRNRPVFFQENRSQTGVDGSPHSTVDGYVRGSTTSLPRAVSAAAQH